VHGSNAKGHEQFHDILRSKWWDVKSFTTYSGRNGGTEQFKDILRSKFTQFLVDMIYHQLHVVPYVSLHLEQ